MEEQDRCEKTARLFKAMAHPTRLRIVELLARDVSCVDDLRAALGLKQPNISQHLAVMRGAQLVTFRREGNRVCYGLADENLPIVVALLGACGARDLREDQKAEKLLGDLRAHFAKIRESGPQ
ncbi:MAG TPA: metalloregulator ArsR/SmtB family transcription factor [bacterium]|nr:metalloregulator ArsR/SmtB family transcription factor [bacterium]